MGGVVLKCPSCDKDLEQGSNFCNGCGYCFSGGGQTGQLNPDTILENRYVIVKTIGRGGMGAVYMALDSRLDNLPVAIKEMSTKAVGGNLQSAIAAFKKEASMLTRLKHPALPVVRDFFSKGEDRWYLVMDYIEGETLAQIAAKRGPIPEADVLDWARQLCEILSYLHDQAPPIIFRDLKPANIMLTPLGHIKLIDFGIARHFRVGNTADTSAYGSHGFAPPEQYGENQTSPASDIYALGATLHFLLTGIDPGKNPFLFDPPSKTQKISPRFETAIMKALDLKAGNRPKDMREMLTLLPGRALGGMAGGSKFTNPQAPHAKTDGLINTEDKHNDEAKIAVETRSSSQTTALTVGIETDNNTDKTSALTNPQITDTAPMNISPQTKAVKSAMSNTQNNKPASKPGKSRNAVIAACIVVVLLISGAYGLSKVKKQNAANDKLEQAAKILANSKYEEVRLKYETSQDDNTSEANKTNKVNSKESEKEEPNSIAVFNDAALEKALRTAINKPQGNVYTTDLKNIWSLDLKNAGVRDISALSYCSNLGYLVLDNNPIKDISPLRNLTKLNTILLSDAQVSNISVLAGLTNLEELWLGSNQIDNLTPLTGLNKLRILELSSNRIKNISPLKNLTKLEQLNLSYNQICDITSLSSMTSLKYLYLRSNQITNVNALAGLQNFKDLALEDNPINDYSPVSSYYQNLSQGGAY